MLTIKKNKRLCVTLSIIMGFLGNYSTLAGTGDPMSEHPSLYDKFRKAVDKNQKNTDSNIPGIRNGVPTIYTRKPDFFGYDELRTIKLFNMPALLSDGNKFLKSMLNLLDVTFECLKQNSGKAKENYKGKPLEFIDACAGVLKNTDEVKIAAKFLDEEDEVIAEGAVASLLQLPLTSGTAMAAVIVSTISFILDVIAVVTIATPAVSTIAKVGTLNHGFGTDIFIRSAIEKGAKIIEVPGKIHKIFHTVEGAGKCFMKVGTRVFTKGAIVQAANLFGCNPAALAHGLGAGVCLGIPALATNVAGGILATRNGISMNNKFKKERVINVANLLSEIVSKMTRFPNLVLESNCMVIAIDRRNLSPVWPWNGLDGVAENQGVYCDFLRIKNLNSPLGKDCYCDGESMKSYLNRFEDFFMNGKITRNSLKKFLINTSEK